MAQTDMNDDAVVDQVEQILDELIDKVALGAAAADGGEVDGGVKAWWRSQYKAKFFYAIRMKKRVYAQDRSVLLKKSEELGKLPAHWPVSGRSRRCTRRLRLTRWIARRSAPSRTGATDP